MLFDRTFHPDEANQAFTVGKLLETGEYSYQPQDHHGPTLYYAAAAIQKAAGHSTTASLDGALLRCTPLLFGVLTIVLAFSALRRLKCSNVKSNPSHSSCDTNHEPRATSHVVSPFVLLATAPFFVFFATDFIQETLLACFLVGMFAAAVFRKPWWFGLSAGLAFATKETSVLSFAAAAAAYCVAVRRRPDWNKCALALLVALLTAVTFYSSFCADWSGVYNAFVAAPMSYLHRAAGDAASTGAAWHVHPWWKHFEWLFLSGWRFSSLPLLALFVLTFSRRSFLHVYALALFALYSLVPYKTPWCDVQLLVPLVLAPFVSVRMLECSSVRVMGLWGFITRTLQHSNTPTLEHSNTRTLFLLLVAAQFGLNLFGLAKMNDEPDSKEIPCNYASASPEVKTLAEVVADALAAPCAEPFAAVAMPSCDVWPFPWYNRASETKTGYWADFDSLRRLAESGAKPSAVVVPMTEGHLVQPLFPHLKRTRRFAVRPGVRARVFW